MEQEILEVEKELEDINFQVEELRRRNEEYRRRLSRLKRVSPRTPMDEEVHFNDKLIYDEMSRRGIEVSFISGTEIVEARYGNHVEIFAQTTSRRISFVDVAILESKFHTKQLLKHRGFSVLEGKLFKSEVPREAIEYVQSELGYPVVLKPNGGCGGDFVFCNIISDGGVRRAYSAICNASFEPSIIVERYAGGVDDYRFFLINGKVRSVVKRTPPVIIGDGKSTIEGLVKTENFRRMNPRVNCLCPIEVQDAESERCLTMQGMTLDTILKNGEQITCRLNANVSTGGDCETVTGKIHASYRKIAEDISKVFPGLPVLAIDFLIQDPSESAKEGTYWICECCCMNPGLSLHTHPSKGKGDDIITPLVDLIFPETITGR